jgi:hypothetical protein
VLLLDSSGKFKAFGSKALDLYYGGDDGFVICDCGENGDLLVEKFKMALNSSDIREYKTPALNGEAAVPSSKSRVCPNFHRTPIQEKFFWLLMLCQKFSPM